MLHRTITSLAGIVGLLLASSAAQAAGTRHEHGGQLFHRFQLDTDIGHSRDGALTRWQMDAWLGGDRDKLALKSEGEGREGALERGELWALYSRNTAEFWDVQAGVRYDREPDAAAFLTLGVEGMAWYFIDTEAHVFLKENGVPSARLHFSGDALLTQSLILRPYAEINLAAADDADAVSGAGLTQTEVGLQLRYAITPRLAPYADVRLERFWGESAVLARSHGEPAEEAIVGVGLRLSF